MDPTDARYRTPIYRREINDGQDAGIGALAEQILSIQEEGLPEEPLPPGPTGARGPTGGRGPFGPRGPRGAAATGPVGLVSVFTGPRGPTGATGPTGARGFDAAVTGPTGRDGRNPVDVTGPTGGDTGEGGPRGAPWLGETGPTGAENFVQGAAGGAGPAGAAGEAGATGPGDLLTSPTGPTGELGWLGATGEAGHTGEPNFVTGTGGAEGPEGAWPAGATGPQVPAPGPTGARWVSGLQVPASLAVLGGARYLVPAGADPPPPASAPADQLFYSPVYTDASAAPPFSAHAAFSPSPSTRLLVVPAAPATPRALPFYQDEAQLFAFAEAPSPPAVAAAPPAPPGAFPALSPVAALSALLSRVNGAAWSPSRRRLVAVGVPQPGATAVAVFSAASGTWEAAPLPSAAFAAGRDVAYSAKQDRFVAVGTGGARALLTSRDGFAWTALSGGPNVEARFVTYSPEAGLWMVAGAGSSFSLYRSADGLVFSPVIVEGFNSGRFLDGRAAAYDAVRRRWVAVGGAPDLIVRSAAEGSLAMEVVLTGAPGSVGNAVAVGPPAGAGGSGAASRWSVAGAGLDAGGGGQILESTTGGDTWSSPSLAFPGADAAGAVGVVYDPLSAAWFALGRSTPGQPAFASRAAAPSALWALAAGSALPGTARATALRLLRREAGGAL